MRRLLTVLVAIGWGINVYEKAKVLIQAEERRKRRNERNARWREKYPNDDHEFVDQPAPSLRAVLTHLLSLSGPEGQIGPVGPQGMAGEPCQHHGTAYLGGDMPGNRV